ERAYSRFSVGDLLTVAIIAHAFDMAEKIDHPGFGPRRRRQHAAPNARRLFAARRLAVGVVLYKIKSDGLYIRAQIQAFDIKQIHLGFVLDLRRELLTEGRRLFANLEPVKKCVRRLEPNSKPVGDLFLLRTFSAIDLAVSRYHLRAASSETGHLANPFCLCALAFGRKFPKQLIEAHQTHFR